LSAVWKYLLLAFALTWMVWIPGTQLHASEVILTFGSTGPALAAMWLARSPDNAKPLRLRRGITFAVAWLFSWIVLGVLPPGTPALQSPFHWNPWSVPLAVFPAWILSEAWSSNAGIRGLMRTVLRPPNWRWPLIALFAMPVFLVVPALLARAAGMPLVVPPHPNGYALLALFGVVFFARSLLFTAMFEEPGWRGTLLPLLLRKHSPLVASLLLWLPWMLWHAPLDLTGGMAHSLAGWIQLRVAALLCQSILFTWLYNRSGQGLLAPILFHASMNTFALVLPYSPPMLALLPVWVVSVVIADRMWRGKRSEAGLLQAASAG